MRGRAAQLGLGLLFASLAAALPATAQAPPAPGSFTPPDSVVFTWPQIFSGGERVPHVCLEGGLVGEATGATPVGPAPCTAIYAPLMLSADDRIDVTVPPAATAVHLTASPGTQVDGRCMARGGGRWACVPHARGWPKGLSTLTVEYPNGLSHWHFDVMSLPPGQRGTVRESELRFRFAGRHLRVQMISRDQPPTSGDELWGRSLRATCAARRGRGDGRSGDYAISRTARWPHGSRAFGFLFTRDLGRARFCFVEQASGADVALVRFPRRR